MLVAFIRLAWLCNQDATILLLVVGLGYLIRKTIMNNHLTKSRNLYIIIIGRLHELNYYQILVIDRLATLTDCWLVLFDLIAYLHTAVEFVSIQKWYPCCGLQDFVRVIVKVTNI
jgi:hypothetical protein